MRLSLVVAILISFTSAAFAEDWSSFIDPNPQKPVASQPAPVVTDTAKPKRVAKASPKAKAKVKARAKTKRRK